MKFQNPSPLGGGGWLRKDDAEGPQRTRPGGCGRDRCLALVPAGTLALSFALHNLLVASPFGLSAFTIQKDSLTAFLCVFPCQLCTE